MAPNQALKIAGGQIKNGVPVPVEGFAGGPKPVDVLNTPPEELKKKVLDKLTEQIFHHQLLQKPQNHQVKPRGKQRLDFKEGLPLYIRAMPARQVLYLRPGVPR